MEQKLSMISNTKAIKEPLGKLSMIPGIKLSIISGTKAIHYSQGKTSMVPGTKAVYDALDKSCPYSMGKSCLCLLCLFIIIYGTKAVISNDPLH